MNDRVFKQIASMWSQSDGQNNTPTKRAESKSEAVRMLIQILVTSLGEFPALWNFGGLDAAVSKVTDPATEAPEGSKWTAEWWQTIRAVMNAFMVFMKMDLTTMNNLTVADTQGAIVLDAAGNPVQPFKAAYDPSDLGAHATDTPEKIMWVMPDTPVVAS